MNCGLPMGANDGITGQELWRSNGFITEQVADIFPGAEGSSVQNFFTALNELFFATQLWVLKNSSTLINEGKNTIGENKLISIYPNPFNSRASINMQLAASQHISISVFDVLGRPVKRIYNGYLTSGSHTFTVEAEHLTVGQYFLHLNGSKFMDTQSFSIIR